MSVIINTNTIRFKDADGTTHYANAVADAKLSDLISDIEDAGSSQIQAIQNKGATTLASIPADYTSVSEAIATKQDKISAESEEISTWDVNGLYVSSSDNKVSSLSGAYGVMFQNAGSGTHYKITRTSGDRLIIYGTNVEHPAVGDSGSVIYDGGTSSVTEYEFTSNSNTYMWAYLNRNGAIDATIEKVGLTGDAYGYTTGNVPVEVPTKAQFDSQSEQIDKHEDEIYNGYSVTNDVKDSLTWNSGYIYNGEVQSSSLSKYSIFELKRNYKVTVKTRNTNVTIIGEADSLTSRRVTPLVTSNASDTYQTFEYTATKDMLCSVCVRWSESEVYVTENHTAILDRLDSQYSEIHNLGSYSTDEVDTGATWIDGRHIYKKTVYFEALGTGDIELPHNINNLDFSIDTSGFCTNGQFSWNIPFSSVDSVGSSMASYVNNNPNRPYVVVKCGSTDRSSFRAWITIKYVKTT